MSSISRPATQGLSWAVRTGLARPGPREPDLLHAIKRAIDRSRIPGWFLITGSANLLLMRCVSESLAGRATYLTLSPMTHAEQLGHGRSGVWEELLRRPTPTGQVSWPHDRQSPRIRARSRSAGGSPRPPSTRQQSRSAIWFEGYVRTYLERDLQDLSSISALPDFRPLMRAAALRLGQLLNQTELGRDIALAHTTVHRYLNLLEVTYLLVRVPAYSVNRTKRFIKSPNLYWGDTGLAMHLAGLDEASGAHLENIVLHDLCAWRDAWLERAEILCWRTTAGQEIDFVIEHNGRLLPLEVKATAFRKECADLARSGFVLHTGTVVEWLAPGILAAPWWCVP